MQIQVEESALDSIKHMAQQLQDERDELLLHLKSMVDWIEDSDRMLHDCCVEDVVKANAAIAKAEGNA